MPVWSKRPAATTRGAIPAMSARQACLLSSGASDDRFVASRSRWPPPAIGPLRTFIPPPFSPGAFVLCAVEALSAALRCVALPYAALRVAAGGARCGRQLWRSALRADCPALLASRGRRKTRYAGCARCAQTAAASQFTKRAAHATLEAALLGAPHGARPAHRLPLRDVLWCSVGKPAMRVAKGCAGGGCGVIMKRRAAQA